MDILRFITAGSVDDGKSTLIGRLLYDSKSILSDQLEILEKQTRNREDGEVDLALLTDGLRAEREQGITIDVAYKYFSTPRRKFIVADAPGHIQYTRNMVTGASTADLMVVLVDARQGIIEQTRRHTIIASLLRIPNIILAVNKMDLVGFDEEIFRSISEVYQKWSNTLGLQSIVSIPLSALKGDNVVTRSPEMPWYTGPSLLEELEEVSLFSSVNLDLPRFAVQYVIRPQTDDLHDYRGYAGKVLSGVFRKGERIMVQPEGMRATIQAVEIAGVETDEIFAPQSATIRLDEDVDVSRGDLISLLDKPASGQSEFNALMCWMDNRALVPGGRYILQQNSRTVRCVIREIRFKMDVNTLERTPSPEEAGLNDVIGVTIKTQSDLAFDPYQVLRGNGSAILIDETTNVTVGALMIEQDER
jgi:sulfate adenylyltransferase subunit 1